MILHRQRENVVEENILSFPFDNVPHNTYLFVPTLKIKLILFVGLKIRLKMVKILKYETEI